MGTFLVPAVMYSNVASTCMTLDVTATCSASSRLRMLDE
jgi:hypothetical protein